MNVELPVLSFTCAFLLLALVPLRRVQEEIPHLALIIWLFLCNLIHGINSILWAGNVVVRIPVWCDLVTKILFGMVVALLAACLCISRSLERRVSSRNVSNDPHHKRTRKMMESALCMLLPIIFMSIHSLVQDYRFDLVENFGCSASVNPSIPPLILIWLPPLLLCIISFAYSAFAIHNFRRRHSVSNSSPYVQTTCSLTDSQFFFGLTVSVTTTTLVFVLILFSIFFPKLQPFTSWSEIHSHFYDINVIDSDKDIASIEFSWWMVPVLSLTYVLLSVVFGGVERHILSFFRGLRSKPNPEVFFLPIHDRNLLSVSTSPSTKRDGQTSTLNLKSGWDEMLDPKKAKTRGLLSKVGPPSPHSRPGSPEPSNSGHSIKSPTHTSPITNLLSPTSPAPLVSSLLQVPTRSVVSGEPNPESKHRPLSALSDDAVSTTSSIWNVPWPEPPLEDLPNSPSRPRSSSSDTSDSFGYPLYPTATPPHIRSQPFEGSASPVPPVPKQALSKRPSRKEVRSQEGKREVIYMTVVKEVTSNE